MYWIQNIHVWEKFHLYWNFLEMDIWRLLTCETNPCDAKTKQLTWIWIVIRTWLFIKKFDLIISQLTLIIGEKWEYLLICASPKLCLHQLKVVYACMWWTSVVKPRSRWAHYYIVIPSDIHSHIRMQMVFLF